MAGADRQVSKIGDPRLATYTQRTRSGNEQVFFTGGDSRDFARYQAEGGSRSHGVTMHDKPDTIRLKPPERGIYAALLDGEWWWVNGCEQCNGRPRNRSKSYIECDQHNVCMGCKAPSSKIEGVRWGSIDGWRCEACQLVANEEDKQAHLRRVANNPYSRSDYWGTDNVICPHCAASVEPDGYEEAEAECDVCGGNYGIETEVTVTYSTTVIGQRLLPDSAKRSESAA